MSRTPGNFGIMEHPQDVQGRNLLANGSGIVAQRGTTFSSSDAITPLDDVYLFDQWYILLTGTVPSTIDRVTTSLTDGLTYAFRFVAGAANTQFGQFQYLETEIVRGLQGESISAHCWMKKTGASLTTARLTIWYTTETGDSEARDLVSSWSGDITATGNWTVLGTTEQTLNTTYDHVVIENMSVPSTATNIIFGVYITDTVTDSGVQFFVGNLKLELGEFATQFDHPSYGHELSKCLHYCYGLDMEADANYTLGIAQASANNAGDIFIVFPQAMRVAPTVSKAGIVTSEIAWFRFAGASLGPSNTFTGTDVLSVSNAMLGMTVQGTILSTNNIYVVKKDGTSSDARIIFSAEHS